MVRLLCVNVEEATNTVGMGGYSDLEYPLFMFQIGQIFGRFSKLVNTLKIKNNLPWIINGIFCRISEIFHSVNQSGASDHEFCAGIFYNFPNI